MPQTSTNDGSISPGSSYHGGQLATVKEVVPITRIRDSRFREATSIISLPLEASRPRSGRSCDASLESIRDPMSEEKFPSHTRRSLTHKSEAFGTRDRAAWSKELASLGNETHRDSVVDEGFAPLPPRKPMKRGLRTMIRRLFGRKLAKNRISMPAPAPATYLVNVSVLSASIDDSLTLPKDPNMFITSAADLITQRSTSAPDPPVSRSSALGSHAPTIIGTPIDPSKREKMKPARPDRSPPALPAKPRRASLPSAIVNVDEGDAANLTQAGPALQYGADDGVDGLNIGFAITSGSNPKRRSRSAGTLRDLSKEHRMSPIQWRQWRRRSDEIRYWRESAGEASPAFDFITATGASMLPSSSPLARGEAITKSRSSRSDDNRAAEDNDNSFNFGLPVNEVPDPEHVGLEERMVTLEIKLMDFEYAISKLQASLLSPRDPRPHEFDTENPRMSEDSASASRPPIPRNLRRRPSQDSSPPASSYSVPITPASQKFQGPLRTPPSQSTGRTNPRPTSVATTLKPGSGHRVSRPGTANLTIEHYTTLMSLIRREQSARLRLEDEVSFLQQQLRLLNPPPLATFRDFSGRHAESPDLASASEGRRRRGYPGSYDADTTDTDDASFHEVYVTPVERGELERGYLRAEEEGVAF